MTEQSQLGGKEMELVTGHGKAEQLEVLAGATGNSERRKRQGRQACGIQEFKSPEVEPFVSKSTRPGFSKGL